MSVPLSPIRIFPALQQYPWGKLGASSLVRNLAGAKGEGPFAELWLGAHPSAPSDVELASGRVSLNSLIEQNPEEALGERVLRQFGPALPFLFKVLSVRTALSVQLHPSKEAAKSLHARRPDLFPDANHKPEIGIALTPVSLLKGFRPLPELRQVFREHEELRWLIGDAECDRFARESDPQKAYGFLREVLRVMFAAPAKQVSQVCQRLVRHFGDPNFSTEQERWVVRLAGEYPNGDIGFFFFFLLNYVKLAPGQAVFTEPGVPHAYLEGDLLECMANSDNVVRAALTHKPKDVSTLLELVDFVPPQLKFSGIGEDGARTRYKTAAEEFEVEILHPSKEQIAFSGRDSFDLLFSLSEKAVVSGSGFSTLTLGRGDSIFVPAHVPSFTLEPHEGAVVRCSVPIPS